MTLEILSRYHYDSNGRVPFAGTEDWVEVANLGSGGYDWAEFKAFHSPSARRYFWHGDSGCSCNSWEEGVDSASDFENGDRDALLRAWKSFAEDNEYNISTTDYTDGITTIRAFKAATK